MHNPELIFVTGPNASGKSSFIRTHIGQLPTFDIIMPDVYKGHTIKIFDKSLKSRNDIVLETVFNDESFKNLVDQAKNSGYYTRMVALFLNSPTDSLNRSDNRRINENGLAISKDTVLLNFNENFKNVARYYFYFDMVDFIYTGANNENLNVMTFEGQEIIRYQTNEFPYIKKFNEFSFSQERLSKESFDIINANKNYSKTLSQEEERVRRFKM